jgi:hypothetical protein
MCVMHTHTQFNGLKRGGRKKCRLRCVWQAQQSLNRPPNDNCHDTLLDKRIRLLSSELPITLFFYFFIQEMENPQFAANIRCEAVHTQNRVSYYPSGVILDLFSFHFCFFFSVGGRNKKMQPLRCHYYPWQLWWARLRSSSPQKRRE